MNYHKKLICLLEEIAANSWPGLYTMQMDFWRLRASHGVTKRANSVFSLHTLPAYLGWYEEIVQFYRRQKLPIRFQISEASPAELDALLDSKGYIYEAKSFMQITRCSTVLHSIEPSQQYEVKIKEVLDEDWLNHYIRIEDYSLHKKPVYSAIMSRIGGHTCYVQIKDGGKTIGIGTGVSERGWTGLLNIAVDPLYRKMGVGAQIVRTIAEWSSNHDVHYTYLQVVADNDAALQLYTKAGYAPLYAYHYRKEPVTSA